jgi:hypothetical protein
MSQTVVASPTDANETVIASVTSDAALPSYAVLYMFGQAIIQVGTNGTAVNLRVRITDIAGATMAQTTALTATAGTIAPYLVLAQNGTQAALPQTYVLTATVTGATATSTVLRTTLLLVAA